MPGAHWAHTKQQSLYHALPLPDPLHPHFTDEATVAWRDPGTRMKSHSQLGTGSRRKAVNPVGRLPLHAFEPVSHQVAPTVTPAGETTAPMLGNGTL